MNKNNKVSMQQESDNGGKAIPSHQLLDVATGYLNCLRDSRAWSQVNCSLVSQGPGLSDYIPWAELKNVVDQWRAEGRFDYFFFMRKPPGLRLRFFGEDMTNNLNPKLVDWLETV